MNPTSQPTETTYTWRPFSADVPLVKSTLFGSSQTQFYLTADQYGGLRTVHLYLASTTLPSISEIQVRATLSYSFGARWYKSAEDRAVLSLDKKKHDAWHFRDGDCKLGDFKVSILLIFDESKSANRVDPFGCPFYHQEGLIRQLASLRLSGKQSDIILVSTVDGRELPAHQLILSMRSSVFEAMFSHAEFTEAQSHQVEIEDVSGQVLEAMLKYIYEGDVGEIEEIAGDLLEAADKYDIPLLAEECLHSMLGSISVENAAKYFYLADLHRLENLKESLVEFISKNKAAVRQSQGWNEFIRPKVDLVEQLFDLM